MYLQKEWFTEMKILEIIKLFATSVMQKLLYTPVITLLCRSITLSAAPIQIPDVGVQALSKNM